MSKISIVIPCYNVEDNIPVTTEVVFKAEELYPKFTQFEYIFVDDGSQDKTLERLMQVHNECPEKVKIVKLSRNFGSNSAALAGLKNATGDCCAILSADLQDPPELLAKMYSYWDKGIKLVVANRSQREEGIQRTFFSAIYHYIMRAIMPNSPPKGGFDLVLFDKQIQGALVSLDEKNAYIPYLIMWMGFDFVSIPYTRKKREIGQSMWSLSKKIKAAIDSVVAFSFAPIRIISVVGFILGIASIYYLGSIIVYKINNPSAITEGWASLMVVFLGVSCFQMISLGIIGEYLWRTLDSSRGRPNFVIDKVINTTDLGEDVKKLRPHG